MNIRNVAIIAHVDHGKTTLVDGLLKQSKTFRENEAAMGQELIMDSNDQERERGITIVAKNTAINYKDYKINIIDTPGHADFGGEVERTLNMADGVVLVVDAQEGPMPQTKFVLKKAFELGLKPIVVINKIDKSNARVDFVIDKIHDLFLDMAKSEEDLSFPVFYAIGREGKAWDKLPADPTEAADLIPIFEAIIKYVPEPKADAIGSFQMLASSLTYDTFQGKYVIGKITRGTVKQGMQVILMQEGGKNVNVKIDKIYATQGLKKIEIPQAVAGDIISVSGIQIVKIGDTIAGVENPEALPRIKIEEPTLRIVIGPNTSPMIGREGEFVTGRHIYDRILQELETNVAMKLETGPNGEYVLSGRGELHLSVFLETLRREGFEMQVSKPQVITKLVDGVEMEPIEELIIDVDNQYSGAMTAEAGRRKGALHHQEENGDGTTRLVYEIPTRGLLGLRNQLLTLSKGTANLSSMFLRYEPIGSKITKLRKGVLIADQAGVAVTYGLNNAQQRGQLFIGPQVEVYEGMIVGINAFDQDIEINVCKEKKLTNVRASGTDDALILVPPIQMSLEQCLDFLEDDELLEITPENLRLRKKYLNKTDREKFAKGKM